MTRLSSLRRLASLLAVAPLLGACGDGQGDAEMPPSAVLGLSADRPLASALDHVRVTVFDGSGGEVLARELPYDGSGIAELPLPALADGTRFTTEVQAFAPGKQTPLLARKVETVALAGRTLLLRVRLNDECIPQPDGRDVSCTTTTCSAGVCVVPYVNPHQLPDYAPGWQQPPQGLCGLVDAGEPSVTIGHPEPPFAPLADGTLITPQMGLQGASHFFFSVAMHNADDATALTRYYGRLLATGRETSVVSIADPYTVNDGHCELYLVPLVLPPEEVAGEVMRLGVTVSDGTGNAGHAHADVLLEEPLPP